MPNNQIAIFGMEHYNIITKIGKVDVIVHDGSFINNIIYKNEDNPEFDKLIISIGISMLFLNFCVINRRNSPLNNDKTAQSTRSFQNDGDIPL